MKEIEINNIKETIIERTDYPIERCREILKDETTAVSYTHLTLPTTPYV